MTAVFLSTFCGVAYEDLLVHGLKLYLHTLDSTIDPKPADTKPKDATSRPTAGSFTSSSDV